MTERQRNLPDKVASSRCSCYRSSGLYIHTVAQCIMGRRLSAHLSMLIIFLPSYEEIEAISSGHDKLRMINKVSCDVYAVVSTFGALCACYRLFLDRLFSTDTVFC